MAKRSPLHRRLNKLPRQQVTRILRGDEASDTAVLAEVTSLRAGGIDVVVIDAEDARL